MSKEHRPSTISLGCYQEPSVHRKALIEEIERLNKEAVLKDENIDQLQNGLLACSTLLHKIQERESKWISIRGADDLLLEECRQIMAGVAVDIDHSPPWYTKLFSAVTAAEEARKV